MTPNLFLGGGRRRGVEKFSGFGYSQGAVDLSIRFIQSNSYVPKCADELARGG